MYLNGLGKLGDDSAYYDYNDYESYPTGSGESLPAPSDTGPTQSIDWTGLIGKAISAYGNVKVAEASQPQQIAPSRIVSPAPAVRPVYSPFSGSLPGTGGLLAIAGAGALAWFLLS